MASFWHNAWQFLLGLKDDFLNQKGDFSLQFHPGWPGQSFLDEVFRQPGWGATLWNLALGAAGFLLVLYVYRREGRSRFARVLLGTLRALLIAFVIVMLNRPMLVRSSFETHPSVVAVLIDDSLSMRVRDMVVPGSADAITREKAATQLLTGSDNQLIRSLARTHVLYFYHFSSDVQPIAAPLNEPLDNPSGKPTPEAQKALEQYVAQVAPILAKIEPQGSSTQVLSSVQRVVEKLQSQRLAGIVILTDGRDVPAEVPHSINGAKVIAVPLGADKPVTNVAVESIEMQPDAFRGDVVSVKATIRGSGFESGRRLHVYLKDRKTGQPLKGLNKQPASEEIAITGKDQAIELRFKPDELGSLDVMVEAERQMGESDEDDNVLWRQLQVLDTKITVLYCDGYPRWEYRYIKNEMSRDRNTMLISCFLLSASPGFIQEGTLPISRFPESDKELQAYDVVILGDVDPRQFSDAQLQMISDFVSRKNGGFGMIAGTHWSPFAFRNTAIEPILPVIMAPGVPDDANSGKAPFLPVVTEAGANSSVFRFDEDKAVSDAYLTRRDPAGTLTLGTLPPIWWYCRGVAIKPGIGIAFAEHPTEFGPDGRTFAPMLVMGHFGGGRTLFSAIDDSWRWRRYTGESIFDTYWIQQLRYLARSKKLGERRFTFSSDREKYIVGTDEQVRVYLNVFDSELLGQLPEQIQVEVRGGNDEVVRRDVLVRNSSQRDQFIASWTPDTVGNFTVRLPGLAGEHELHYQVRVQGRELSEPKLDRVLLSTLAAQTSGTVLNYADAAQKLPALLPSAAQTEPLEEWSWLWDAPLVLVIFVLLITAEWVLRKVYGML